MNRLINVALVTLSCLVGVGLIEAIVRVTGIAAHLTTDPAFVADPRPGVGSRYKSHFRGRVQGPTELATNSFGARDREFERDKAAGVLRLVVMGDSVAFGQGVALGQAFPKLIEQDLSNLRAGRLVEVINFGVQGYSLNHEVARFRADGVEFHPDVAVLAAIANDLDPARDRTFVDEHGYLTKQAGGDRPWKAFLRHIHTAYLIKGYVYAFAQRAQFGGSGAAAGEALAPSRRAVLEREVAKFVDASRQAGATPVFALVDFERTAETDAIVRHVRERFPDIAVIDCAPAFDGKDMGRYIVPRDKHPNAAAHRIIADEMLARLLELPPLRAAAGAPATQDSATRAR